MTHDRDDADAPRLAPWERDLLFWSSGELAWWRRPLAALRLRFSREARRQAAMLGVLELVGSANRAAPRPRPAPHPLRWPATLAAAALLLLGAVGFHRLASHDGPRRAESTVALSRSSGRLLLTCRLDAAPPRPGRFDRRAFPRGKARRPALPTWSRLRDRDERSSR